MRFTICNVIGAISNTGFLLSGSAFKVLTAITRGANDGFKPPISVISLEDISDMTGKSDKVIAKALAELEMKGYIKPLPEKDAYDLSGLLEIVSTYYRLLKVYDENKLLKLLYESVRGGKTYQPIISIMRRLENQVLV